MASWLKKAIRLIRAAADMGDANAQLNAGKLFDHISGESNRNSDAVHYCRMVYAQRNVEAAFRLGRIVGHSRNLLLIALVREPFTFAADRGVELEQLAYLEPEQLGN
jgi:TPR repeat protein